MDCEVSARDLCLHTQVYSAVFVRVKSRCGFDFYALEDWSKPSVMQLGGPHRPRSSLDHGRHVLYIHVKHGSRSLDSISNGVLVTLVGRISNGGHVPSTDG